MPAEFFGLGPQSTDSGSQSASLDFSPEPLTAPILILPPASTLPKCSAASIFAELSAPCEHRPHIAFRCKSLQRRNVEKSMVRTLKLFMHKAEGAIQTEYRERGWDEIKRVEVAAALDALAEDEKAGGAKTKDYANIVSRIIDDKYFRVFLKHCLLLKLRFLRDTPAKRVLSKNKEFYIATLEDYLVYMNGISS